MCVNSLYNCLCTSLQSVQQCQRYDCTWLQTGPNLRQCVLTVCTTACVHIYSQYNSMTVTGHKPVLILGSVFTVCTLKKKKSETKLTAAILKEDKNMQKVRNECLFLIKQDKTVRKFSRNFLFVKQINILTLHFNGRRMFKMKIVFFFVCKNTACVPLYIQYNTVTADGHIPVLVLRHSVHAPCVFL